MNIGNTPERSLRLHWVLLVSVLVVGVSAQAIAQHSSSLPAARTLRPIAQAVGTTTFADDCVTPKTTFNLGDTVCAKAEGLTGFRLAWVDPDGFLVQKTNIINDPQTDSFTLPVTDQSAIGGFFTANNLGTWRVTAITSRNSVRIGGFFTVKDPANARADLSIVNSVVGGDTPVSGGSIQFAVTITNLGPDDAANVVFKDDNFSNASFNSLAQTGGPQFSCNGATCTLASFPNGAVATFVLNFTAGGSGGVLENTVTVSSDTTDLHSDDNSAPSPPIKVGTAGTPPTCSLECPNNIVVSANTTNQGSLGAFVTLPATEAFGTCGPVSLSPASGSFFAVGVTTVSATSSGGGFCSFTVTVIDTPPPTINCPPNISVTAPSGQGTAFVPDPNGVASNPGNATATGSNVTVVGERGDDLPLSDSYPVGVTMITWTATDDGGRAATCIQRITVTSPDAPTIHCPSDKTFNAPSGSCLITVLAEDIGLPSTTGLNVTVSSTRSDGLVLTAPYPAGDTLITWTASNALGNASCNQRIHVTAVDIDPPALSVPPDVTVFTTSCSAVLDDELGVATATDNCSGSVSVIRTGVPPNFVFPTGTTNVTYTAMDAAGNATTRVQHVTVLESPAVRPTIAPPPDVTVNTGPGATTCGAVVSNSMLGNASATDNCPGVAITRSGVPGGNLFPVGDTFVTYTATDASGNAASVSQKVTVIDNTVPVVTAPAAVTLFTGPGATSCDVTVTNLDATLGTGSATDNCPSVGPVTRSGVPFGNKFPVGTTTLTYSATDAHGNAGSATQLVTVVDNTTPEISCPPNMTLEPTCPAGAIATWAAPVGTDNCPSVTTAQSGGPVSGSVFPTGATTVTYTARDAAGNQASCSFTVTVLTVTVALTNLENSVSGSALSGPQRQGLIPKLESALAFYNRRRSAGACQMLSDFSHQVQIFIDHGDVPPAQGNAWLVSAAHIANALGCTNDPCQ